MVRKYDISSFPKFKTGCPIHDDCFTCPLDDCKEGSSQLLKQRETKPKAQALYSKGFDVTQIAKELDKSERTIQRYLNDN